jgi:hypothetical protein
MGEVVGETKEDDGGDVVKWNGGKVFQLRVVVRRWIASS